MPNSINILLFDNDERVLVGTIYRKQGKNKAVIEGLKLLERKIEELVDKVFESIDVYKQNLQNDVSNDIAIKIYCSRGGMRSMSIAWLMDKYKFKTFTLKRGYKNYRNWVLETFIRKWNIIVIGGKTGTGKTKILQLLEKYNYQALDLEKYASHRGSTFGGLGMQAQPSNEHFENQIAEKLNIFNHFDPIFVEAESSNIGKCKIPHEFFNQMKTSRRIEIIRSESNRLDELIHTYSIFSPEDLKDPVLRIRKRLDRKEQKFLNLLKKEMDLSQICTIL